MRLDLFFSTYIIIWCFLYYFKIIKYNPYIFLIIAIIVSIIILFHHKDDFDYTIYISLNFIKIPCLLLLDFYNIIEGFLLGIVLCIIYIFYISIINKKNIIDIYYHNLMDYI